MLTRLEERNIPEPDSHTSGMSLVPYGEGMCSAGGLKGSEVFAAAGLKGRGDATFSAVGAGGAGIYCKKEKHQACMLPSCKV